MRYKFYGKTGKKLSCVGFGGMRFDLNNSLAENAELVRYANAKGINYFDTAPGYCDDKSERIYGEAFKDMPGEFYVSTKAMPETFDTAEKIKTQVHQSLDRLGTGKIHFFHLWCLRRMEHYELAMRPGGMYEGLLELQQQGLIEHIVCSSHQTGEGIREVVEDGKLEGVLLGLNILNFPYRWEGVETAHRHGWGVVAMNPLGGGMIPQYEKEFSYLSENGETPTEAAMRFVMACPEITVALVGFTTREQIDAACAVADKAEPLTPERLEALKNNLGENMNAACTACGYCVGCPRNIPIVSYMQYYNEKQLFGRTADAMRKGIYFQHMAGLLSSSDVRANECMECMACEEACTQHLPIVERLREMAEWEAKMKRD